MKRIKLILLMLVLFINTINAVYVPTDLLLRNPYRQEPTYSYGLGSSGPSWEEMQYNRRYQHAVANKGDCINCKGVGYFIYNWPIHHNLNIVKDSINEYFTISKFTFTDGKISYKIRKPCKNHICVIKIKNPWWESEMSIQSIRDFYEKQRLINCLIGICCIILIPLLCCWLFCSDTKC